MARFRAVIQGARGPTSRLGNVQSGIAASIDGWETGVRVEAFVNGAGVDKIVVYATGGSLGRRAGSLIAVVTAEGVEQPKQGEEK